MTYLSTATLGNYVVSTLKAEVNLDNIYKFGIVTVCLEGLIAI
jgi:hypothetical protein